MMEQQIDQELTYLKVQEEPFTTMPIKPSITLTQTIFKQGETFRACIINLEEALNNKIDKVCLILNHLHNRSGSLVDLNKVLSVIRLLLIIVKCCYAAKPPSNSTLFSATHTRERNDMDTKA